MVLFVFLVRFTQRLGQCYNTLHQLQDQRRQHLYVLVRVQLEGAQVVFGAGDARYRRQYIFKQQPAMLFVLCEYLKEITKI